MHTESISESIEMKEETNHEEKEVRMLSRHFKKALSIRDKAKKRQGFKGVRRLEWSSSEQQGYLLFIWNNKDLFKDRQTRTASKVFEAMSEEVETRSPQQCRYHHLKMMRKNGSISETILRHNK